MRVGDVFLVPLVGKLGRHGQLPVRSAGDQHIYGQVVNRATLPPPGREIEYLVVLYRSTAGPLTEITRSEIDLAGIIYGFKLRQGDWPLVGNVPPPPLKTAWFGRDGLVLENFDGSVRRQASAAEASKHPRRHEWADDSLQCAAEAKHGFRSWTPRFERYRELAEELTTGEVATTVRERHEQPDSEPTKSAILVAKDELNLSNKAWNWLTVRGVTSVDQIQPILEKYRPNMWVTEELWEALEDWQISHPGKSLTDDVLRAHTEWERAPGEPGPNDRLGEALSVAVRKYPKSKILTIIPRVRPNLDAPEGWESVLVTGNDLWEWECNHQHSTPSEARECGRREVRRLRSIETAGSR